MAKFDGIPGFIKDLPQIDLPVEGAKGWMLGSSGRQIVFVEFDEAVEVPEHAHDEQWEVPLAGKVTLHMEGRSMVYEAGQNFYIPANVPHGASVAAGYKALIVFNEPDRYKPKA